jgi:hypothetical protein
MLSQLETIPITTLVLSGELLVHKNKKYIIEFDL